MTNELKLKLTQLLADYEKQEQIGKEYGIRATEIRNVLKLANSTPVEPVVPSLVVPSPIALIPVDTAKWESAFNEKASKEGLDIKSKYFSDCDSLFKMSSHYTNLVKLYGGDMAKMDEITKEYDLNKKYLTERYNG